MAFGEPYSVLTTTWYIYQAPGTIAETPGEFSYLIIIIMTESSLQFADEELGAYTSPKTQDINSDSLTPEAAVLMPALNSYQFPSTHLHN